MQGRQIILTGGYTIKHLFLELKKELKEHLKNPQNELHIYYSTNWTEDVNADLQNFEWGQKLPDFPQKGTPLLNVTDRDNFLQLRHIRNFHRNWVQKAEKLARKKRNFRIFQYDLNGLQMRKVNQEIELASTFQNVVQTKRYATRNLIFIDCRISPRMHFKQGFNQFSRPEDFFRNPNLEGQIPIIILGNGPTALWIGEACRNNNRPFKYESFFDERRVEKFLMNERNQSTMKYIEANHDSVYLNEKDGAETLDTIFQGFQKALMKLEEGSDEEENCSEEEDHPEEEVKEEEDPPEEVKEEDPLEEEKELERLNLGRMKAVLERYTPFLENYPQNHKMRSFARREAFKKAKSLRDSLPKVINRIEQVGVEKERVLVALDCNNSFIDIFAPVLCIGYEPNSFQDGDPSFYESISKTGFEEDITPVTLFGSVHHQLFGGISALGKRLGFSDEKLMRRSGFLKLFLTKDDQDLMKDLMEKNQILLSETFFTNLQEAASRWRNTPSGTEAIETLRTIYFTSTDQNIQQDLFRRLLNTWAPKKKTSLLQKLVKLLLGILSLLL